MARMIWSESLGEMVVRGFKVPLKHGGYAHYTWYDPDCLYYNDDTEAARVNPPRNAILDGERRK